MEQHVVIAFLLTLLAGLSTGLGSGIAFFAKESKTGILSFGLGFSGGVMVYISLVEILKKSQQFVARAATPDFASWIVIGSFFLGIAITSLIDKAVPEQKNPHEARCDKDVDKLRTAKEISDKSSSDSLLRTGVLTALAIAIHNFPEGLVTFLSALVDPYLGVSIAVAVAIHNIPEGISVSVPIFYATGNKKRAFAYSFSSGLSEPAGALVGYFLLRPFLNEIIIGVLFAAVAGVMVFISFDELLPAAREYGKGHTAILGVVLGMAVMATSLLLFQ